MAITRAQQARQMYKEGSKKPVVQGGVDNYLGDQPQVVVPRKWQSGPDKPPTELAYITEAEKKLLLKEDIHGSLKEGPNEGPAGIMSLDSFGDIDDSGQDVGMAGGDVSRAESGDFSGIPSDRQEQAKDIRAGFVAAGGQETKEEKKDKEFQKKKKEIKKTFSPLSRYNRQRKRDYIDYLKKQKMDKIRKGLIQYQDKVGQIQGLTDFDTLQDYINQVQSVDDLVASGFYSDDGRFAKGDIPDFTTTKPPGVLGLLADKFSGPVTKERLNELLGQVTDLTALETGPLKNLQDTNINKLMETYEPNRFKLMNPEQGGRDDDPILPIIPKEEGEETPEDPRQVLSTRILGSQFDPTFFAADGGIMNADIVGGMMDGNMDEMGRQMYGLGKLVKKATRAVKKIVKSPVGKIALGAAAAKFGGFGLGGLKGKLFGLKGIDEFGGTMGLLGDLGLTKGFGSFMPTAFGGITLASILPLLAGKTEDEKNDILKDYYAKNQLNPATTKRQMGSEFDFYNYNLAEGGMPSKEPVAKKTMPLLDMGGKEKDYRETGGFVDMGRMERADDVPARLSKNEFVFTADAVRNAGDGDIDKGAEVMYNMMKSLEAGGDVSEESQGLEGARKMFQTSQRSGEVL